MNILVTGGSGFIGRNIVKMLKEEGNTVGTYDIKTSFSLNVSIASRSFMEIRALRLIY